MVQKVPRLSLNNYQNMYHRLPFPPHPRTRHRRGLHMTLPLTWRSMLEKTWLLVAKEARVSPFLPMMTASPERVGIYFAKWLQEPLQSIHGQRLQRPKMSQPALSLMLQQQVLLSVRITVPFRFCLHIG